MKKIAMALMAATMMSMNMTAQTEQQPERRQITGEEMTKMRTEQMVKEYGLSEEQSAKLLDLNKQYADKLPPMMGRGPQGGPRGQRPQAAEGQRPQRPDSAGQGNRRMERGQRPQFNREEMQKNMEAYNASLQNILTAEQYEKYKTNMENRMQRGQRGGQGPRQQRQQRQGDSNE